MLLSLTMCMQLELQGCWFSEHNHGRSAMHLKLKCCAYKKNILTMFAYFDVSRFSFTTLLQH